MVSNQHSGFLSSLLTMVYAYVCILLSLLLALSDIFCQLWLLLQAPLPLFVGRHSHKTRSWRRTAVSHR